MKPKPLMNNPDKTANLQTVLTPHMKPKPLMNNPDKTANLQTNATARITPPETVAARRRRWGVASAAWDSE